MAKRVFEEDADEGIEEDSGLDPDDPDGVVDEDTWE